MTMNLHYIANVIFSVWMWGMTFDIAHSFVTTILLTSFLYLTRRYSFIKSLILSVASDFFSSVIFSMIAQLLYHHTTIENKPAAFELTYSIPPISPFTACLDVALFHAILQSVFFLIGHHVFKAEERKPYYLIALSNFLASIFCYINIRLFMWHSL